MQPMAAMLTASQKARVASAQGLFRAVRASNLLKGCGSRLEKDAHLEEDVSVGVEDVDVFISHTWDADPFSKYLALCFAFNHQKALKAGAAAIFILFFTYTQCRAKAKNENAEMFAFEVWLVPVLFELCWLGSWYLTLFLGQNLWNCLDPTIWFDKLCIDQRDPDRKAHGIQALPGFVMQSSQLLLLYDTSYLDRLWCMTELAFFVKKHGAAHVWFLPLWLPRWLLYAQLLSTLAMATSAAIGFLSLSASVSSEGLPVLSPDRGWNHFLNNLSWVPYGLFSYIVVLLPLMRSLMDSTREHQEMLQHLQDFEVRNCKVSDESDRVTLESLIQQAFDAMDEPVTSVAVECGVGEDQALLVPTKLCWTRR